MSVTFSFSCKFRTSKATLNSSARAYLYEVKQAHIKGV